jgi:hypothetical protein
MTETICRSCGSEEPDVIKISGFCNQALNWHAIVWWIYL